MRGKHNAFVLLTLAALAMDASAWGNATYVKAADYICGEYNCGCGEAVRDAVMLPDTFFRDNPRHHCFNVTPRYGVAIDFWKTPASDDCPALESMDAWFNEAANESGCRMWRSLGIALHYFLDSREFWNTVVEANKTCVRDYEEIVDDYVKYGGDDWEACRCGFCTKYEELSGILLEYKEKIKGFVESKHYDKPRVLVLANSIDRGSVKELETYLRLNGVDVDWTNASGFNAHKMDEFIAMLGGQNSPEGVGEIVSGILTEEEEANILANRLSGNAYKKLDVWASNQKIRIYAGYEAEQTAGTVFENKGDILAEALSSLNRTAPECTKPEDCGSEYYGAPVCGSGMATRVLYRPSCRGGRCLMKAVRASTEDCSLADACINGVGCVWRKGLPKADMVYRRNYTARISPDTLTLFTGTNTSADIYIGNYGVNYDWQKNVRCQYSTNRGEGWSDILNVSYGNTAKYAVNITGWPKPGPVVYSYMIRCGNTTGNKTGSYFNVTFAGTLNLTIQWVARPLQFAVGLTPPELVMDSCNDLRYVNVTVKNLGVKNITCSARTELASIDQFTVYRPGASYNVSEFYRHWKFRIENLTNYSTYFNMNVTYEQYINWTNRTVNYTWEMPYWNSRELGVYTGDCSITEFPVHVTCNDTDRQAATKTESVKISYRTYINPG